MEDAVGPFLTNLRGSTFCHWEDRDAIPILTQYGCLPFANRLIRANNVCDRRKSMVVGGGGWVFWSIPHLRKARLLENGGHALGSLVEFAGNLLSGGYTQD